MDSPNLIENFATGIFEAEDGQRFVRCEFNPEKPVWINVTGKSWSAVYAGRQYELNWATINLPDSVSVPLQLVVLARLNRNAPPYLNQVKTALNRLVKAAKSANVHFQNGFFEINASAWLTIWRHMNSHSRSLIRSLYEELAEKGLAGASFTLSQEMNQWKAKNDTQTLRNVLEWDADSGSLTSSEWELIRNALNYEDPNENDADCAIRMFGQILNETLKRPLQVLSMKRDALWIAPSGRETFLRIPKGKAQTGEKPASWQITDALGNAIQAYSERPLIRVLQERFDRLIVIPASAKEEMGWMAYGQVDGATAKSLLQRWALQQKIISPRTNREINFTPYRIRHTGATAMALQGVPRDQIQEILEHDSPESADAYIHAVGSDLMPALERATDRGVGTLFSELHNVYFFKGEIVDRTDRRPIYIPMVDELAKPPAIVGGCGKDGACTKHPFWACYNGCPHFLAWRDAPHQKALDYVESEQQRWSNVEGGKERSKLGKDFDRTGAGIIEVIFQIDLMQKRE